MFVDATKIAAIAKGLGAYVVAGGPHATIAPESLIDHFDIVVNGEGEEVMAELIPVLGSADISHIQGIWYRSNGQILRTPQRNRFIEMDSLELPALELVDIDLYMKYWHYFDAITPRSRGINIMASRGCAFNCSFCQPTIRRLFGAAVRFKSPEYLVRQIQCYIDKYKVNTFFFHDDTFAADRKWLITFLDLLKSKNLKIFWGCNMRISGVDGKLFPMMYKMGLRCIHFGIETASQRILDQVYQKGTKIAEACTVINRAKKANVHVGGFFMLGAPDEIVKEVNKTIKFAISSGLDEASFSIVNPLPGTRLHDMVKNNRKYILNSNNSDFDYYKRVSYSGGSISKTKLIYFQKKALLLFYLHPSRLKYLLKHFLSLKGIVKLYTKVRRFF